MKTKNVALFTLLVTILLFVGFSFLHVAPTSVTTPVVQTALGALSSPDIQSPYVAWGGVRHFAARTESLTQASTTVCALRSPSATSTLTRGTGIRFNVSSTTASVVGVYKAATPYAQTTFLFGALIAANAQATITATTTTDNFVIAPNSYITVLMSGGTGTFSPSGVCQAEFTTL